MDNTQNIISFCSGYGGIELGIKRTGLPIRTVCYVEIEAFAQANLVAKIEQGKMDAAPIWSNLKTFDGRPFRGKVHGIIGGYPCQPFSNAGQRKGTEDPRHLFPYICEHIRTIRPLWCFFENVGGHLNLGFDEVYKSLRDLGYQVEAGLFTAAEVGAPHKRERLFILAKLVNLDSNGHIGYTEPTQESSRRRAEATTDTDGGELGNTKHNGLPTEPKLRGNETPSDQRRKEESIEAGESTGTDRPRNVQGVSGGTSRSEQLADPSSKRSQAGLPEQGQRQEGQPEVTHYDCDRWPARPGQPQYDWEEPRTVKSGMGRTIDGFASRVDELRLLGNGVVPQTAELAFRTLWNKI